MSGEQESDVIGVTGWGGVRRNLGPGRLIAPGQATVADRVPNRPEFRRVLQATASARLPLGGKAFALTLANHGV